MFKFKSITEYNFVVLGQKYTRYVIQYHLRKYIFTFSFTLMHSEFNIVFTFKENKFISNLYTCDIDW